MFNNPGASFRRAIHPCFVFNYNKYIIKEDAYKIPEYLAGVCDISIRLTICL